MSLKEKLKELVAAFDEVLFSPEKCVACCREKSNLDMPFCERCESKIKTISGKVCDKCGMPITCGNICDKCKHDNFHFDHARAKFVYDEHSSPMITRFKYASAKYLANRLSDFLVEVFAECDFLCDVVTFVPISPHKLKARGYNQTEELAKFFCEKLCLKLECLLAKTVDTKAQAGLTRKERQKNLKGTFAATDKSKIKGKSILLIDDVFTTGSTTDECARVLKNAGALQVNVITIAKTCLQNDKN